MKLFLYLECYVLCLMHTQDAQELYLKFEYIQCFPLAVEWDSLTRFLPIN